MEQHRSHLEKRLGAGDIPPAAATDYKVNLPDALKDLVKADELAASPDFQKFTAGLHAMGLTQKQYDGVVAEMLDRSIALQKGMAGLDTQACLAELDKTWSTPDERAKNVQAAYRAASAFGDVDGLMKKYGNDPDFIRFAAKVGAELKEDTSAGGDASGDKSSEMEIQALAASPAYFNPADPQHAIVKQRVTAYYDRKYGTAPKSNGSVSIGQV